MHVRDSAYFAIPVPMYATDYKAEESGMAAVSSRCAIGVGAPPLNTQLQVGDSSTILDQNIASEVISERLISFGEHAPRPP